MGNPHVRFRGGAYPATGRPTRSPRASQWLSGWKAGFKGRLHENEGQRAICQAQSPKIVRRLRSARSGSCSMVLTQQVWTVLFLGGMKAAGLASLLLYR